MDEARGVLLVYVIENGAGTVWVTQRAVLVEISLPGLLGRDDVRLDGSVDVAGALSEPHNWMPVATDAFDFHSLALAMAARAMRASVCASGWVPA